MLENKDKKIKYAECIWSGVVICLPLLIALVVAVIGYIQTGLFPEPGLKWNDEAAYLQMIKNCITTGQPIGYWGFNGNHAIVGTGGAWSPAIIWPYAIFAFIFPLTAGFVYYVNLFYITLANLIFLLCVRPEKSRCIRLALLQATSAVLILYLSVNMSEIFRYALAIVIAGLLYRMFFKNCSAWLKYIVIPLVILASVQVYVFFAFCVPVYVFALLKKSRLWVKLSISVGAMGVVALGSYYLLHLISSNYNIYKTEALLTAVKSLDIAGAVLAFMRMMKQGLVQVFQLWAYVYSNALIPWHVLFCFALVIIGAILVARMLWHHYFRKAKDAKDNNVAIEVQAANEKREAIRHDGMIGMIVVYSIPLFFLMYVTLYSIEPFTFVRGTQIAVVFSLWFLAMVKDKVLFYIVLVFQAISLLFLPANMEYFMSERYMTPEVKQEWAELEQEFEQVFVVDRNLGPWANTVAMYTMEPKVICALPGGMGVNFIMQDDVFAEEAGYVLCSKTPSDRLNGEWLEKSYADIRGQFGEKLEKQYNVIYESESYIVFRKL